MAAPVKSQFESVMNQAFAAHAITNAIFVEKIDGPLLEHPGANAAFDVPAAFRFQNNGVYSPQVKQVREKQAGGTGSNDSYLSGHHSLCGNCLCFNSRGD